MAEKIESNTKDINTNFQNNISKENSKHQNPLNSINSNNNPKFNSYPQENIFNELINSTNYQESKGNSSFYNFSESVQSNQENINANQNNTNIVINKEQLYQTFLLFQKFLSQNMYNNNNSNISNNNTISPTKKENKIENKVENNYKNNNVNEEINEINNFNKNENMRIYNGKDISENNKISEMNKKCQDQFQNDENLNNNIHKELVLSKSHCNIKNGGSDNIIFFDGNEKVNENENLNINNITKLNNLNTNKNYQRRNSSDLNNKVTKNSYDDIPIKFNKENFIDLVEKKLADEKKYGNMNKDNAENKIEFLHKIKQRKKSENLINKFKIKNDKNRIKINDSKDIVDKENNIEILNKEKNKNEKELKLLERKKNNISNNYSFDKEATQTFLLNDNKNTNIGNNSIIENLNSINNKSDRQQNASIISNDNNIILSKESLNKLFLKNLKENIKNYKISKLEICLMHNKEKKINESENKETNEKDQKEEIMIQKMKKIELK
jgi:hypothetical protein